MTSAINNYNYSAATGSSLSSSVKDVQENPENFQLYMAKYANSLINSLNSSAVYDADSDESDDGSSSAFSTLGMSTVSGLSGADASGVDALSLFSSSNNSSSMDFSSLLGVSSLDSYKVSETLEQLKNYSDISETKRWVGQTVTYVDPDNDTMTKSGVVTKVIVENIEKPVLIVDGNQISVDDLVSIDLDSQNV